MAEIFQKLNEKLHLECPICFADLVEEKDEKSVFQCFNGHIVCSDCKTQLTRCPVCRVQCLDWTKNRLADLYIAR